MLLIMKKFILRIVPQSFSDVITNSSSELFVFLNGTTGFIKNQLDEFVPGWDKEYEYPILFSDMNEDAQKRYIEWVFDLPWFFEQDYYDIEAYNRAVTIHVTRTLCIPDEEVPMIFDNWNKPDYFEDCYGKKHMMYHLKISEFGYELLKNKYKNDICLWSIDENPDWTRQELIMSVLGARRYHLG